MKKMELISFKLCPFVQRAVITLNYKKVDFDITYIDLSKPPEWFKKISPLGKVPVLKVDDEILFESAVIQEYIDEVTPPSLHPTDPLTRAKNRAWISFSGDLFMLSHQMINLKTKEDFEKKSKEFATLLQRLENVHSGKAYFNGTEFNLIDATYAPFFMRMDLITDKSGLDLFSQYPKLQNWSKQLLSMSCVKSSVVDDFPKIYSAMLQNTKGYISSL